MSALLGLGLQPKDLSTLQVCLRAIIVFITALITVRLAHILERNGLISVVKHKSD
jgi:uncharacterized membrane protein YcaP (DUF421 family)